MRRFWAVCLMVLVAIPFGLLAQGTAEKAVTPAATPVVDDMSKKYTITYYHNSPSARIDESKDEILKVLDEKFNMDLKINIITSDYESKLNLEVSSGNAPDMMVVSKEQFKSLEAQGIFLPLEDQVQKMPNFMKRYPDILTDPTLRYNGHLYFLQGHDSPDQVVKAYTSIWIRKDWLDKLGLSVPKTLDDFKNVAIAFAKKDPDGNGVNDTFGFSGLGARVTNKDQMYAWNPILGAFGIGELAWTAQDGKLVFDPMTAGYKQALQWISSFIATGAVDPDIMFMDTYDQLREKAYRNQVGMIYMSWAEFTKPPYGDILKQMTPNAQWIQIASPIGPDGKQQYDSVYSIPGMLQNGRVLSAELAKDPAKLARVLKYLDYICYGPGLDLVCYGIEGVHWNRVNGKIVPTNRIGEVSYSWQHQNMGRLEKEYLSTKFNSVGDNVAFAAGLPRIDGYSNYITIPAGSNMSDLNRYVNEESVRFMYGKRPMSEFDNFVKTLYSTYNLQQYLDLGTKNLKAAGILK